MSQVQAPNVSDDSLLNALSAIADIARMVIEKGGEIGKCLRQSYYDAFAGELREVTDRIEKESKLGDSASSPWNSAEGCLRLDELKG